MIRSRGTTTWFKLTPCLVRACKAWLCVLLLLAGCEADELENVSASEVSLESSGLVRPGPFCLQSWQVSALSVGGGADRTLLKLGTGKEDWTLWSGSSWISLACCGTQLSFFFPCS